MQPIERKWWKEAVVYQIYPQSFQDSNGDGIGDIPGIISRLDHIHELGASVIWLSPVYESPLADNGYDISNYQAIHATYGTLDDWRQLLDEVHRRGMKLIMDLVVNHTSDEHPWFVESRSSTKNTKRDYYVWRQGREGREPTNWSSFFTPSAWTLDEATGEYYLHLFSEKQPDLNWENPAVRSEVFRMMTWWLDLGIDGFRMDVINLISKVQTFPDSTAGASTPYRDGSCFYMNGPRVHEYLQEMNREVLSKHDVMTVGETIGVTPQDAIRYVGPDRGELNMVFQFELMGIDSGPEGKWDLKPWSLAEFKRIMNKWQTELDQKGWNSLYLNNHDQPRQVSRFGNDSEYRVESAKLLATMLYTQQGTPYIFQGEEIGMTNVRFPSIADYRDIETLNMYEQARAAGWTDEKAMTAIYAKSRDNARTPMQWDATVHAGFTSGEPWIQANPNCTWLNAANDKQSPASIFRYYQKLIRLRKEHLALVYGHFEPVLDEQPEIYAYYRCLEKEKYLVILNFSAMPVELPALLTGQTGSRAVRLIGNYPASQSSDELKMLRPYEACVYQLK